MIDRKKIEELVRAALLESGTPNRTVDASGALVIPKDRGDNLGAPMDGAALRGMLDSTPARIAVGRAGTRYRTNTLLRFRADHAAAKDAVVSEVDPQLLARLGLFEVKTRADD